MTVLFANFLTLFLRLLCARASLSVTSDRDFWLRVFVLGAPIVMTSSIAVTACHMHHLLAFTKRAASADSIILPALLTLDPLLRVPRHFYYVGRVERGFLLTLARGLVHCRAPFVAQSSCSGQSSWE